VIQQEVQPRLRRGDRGGIRCRRWTPQGRRTVTAALIAVGASCGAPPAGAQAAVHNSSCLLHVTTPYTERHPLRFALSLNLNPDGNEYVASVPFSGITVQDSRRTNRPWTLRLVASKLRAQNATPNAIHAVNGQDVGLVGLHVVASANFDRSTKNLNLSNHRPADPAVAYDAAGTLGLGGKRHTVAAARHGRGVVTMAGDLLVVAPTSTPPGSYSGTLTFTVGCSKAIIPVKPPKPPHPPPHPPTQTPTPPVSPPASATPTPSVQASGGQRSGPPSSHVSPGGGAQPPSGRHPGGVLPFTGAPAAAFTLAGFLAVLAGLAFLVEGRRRPTGKHRAGGAHITGE
jgi:hypothetical protein